jgi:1-acyl-sn-glycerol-3-phosphate acyltransferase
MKILARIVFFFCNFRRKGDLPKIPQYLLILAPHTSNWDTVIGYLLGKLLDAPEYKFLVKIQAVQNKFYGWILLLMGAMPVNREYKSPNKKSMTTEAIKFLRENPNSILIITPEGTRDAVPWHESFYQICLELDIPLVKGLLDYKGAFTISEAVYMTGNREDDFEKIKKWYTAHSGGKYTPKFK